MIINAMKINIKIYVINDNNVLIPKCSLAHLQNITGLSKHAFTQFHSLMLKKEREITSFHLPSHVEKKRKHFVC